jgi:hypothetical protein
MQANNFSPSNEFAISSSASISADKEQAFYDKHADPVASARTIMWLLGALIVLVGSAAIAEDKVKSGKSDELIKTTARVTRGEAVESEPLGRTAITSPVTTFVDGPTGFVFVYTADGWKYVRNLNKD